MKAEDIEKQRSNWDSLKSHLDLLTHLQNRRRYAWDSMISYREARRGCDPKAVFAKIWKRGEQDYKRIYWKTCEQLQALMLGEKE